MNILGISGFCHDSAACLLQDGEIIAAAQEERFSRKKHDFGFPLNAINYCLKQGGIKASELDYVGFYEKPFIEFKKTTETALAYAPLGLSQFVQSAQLLLKQKFWIKKILAEKLAFKGKILFANHHESLAASAFFPSPFEEAAFLITDGSGEWETTSFGIGKSNSLEIKQTLQFPHSLGLLYSAFTYHAGFKVNSGEYKLMGLAPYGEPVHKDLILRELVDLKNDGSFRLNMEYFGFCDTPYMTNARFDRIFGAKPREPETEIRQIDMDMAASIQKVTEDILLKTACHVHEVTGQRKLCLSGGVALNCVANSCILKQGPFEDVWIQPASSDAGGALGVALIIWHKYLGKTRSITPNKDSLKGSLLGPAFSDADIEEYLTNKRIPFSKIKQSDLPEIAAELIDKNKIIGWFQGRMEFGPRALGARSILADARAQEMQSRINLKIKFRESFRPCAPTVLEEQTSEWFELRNISPYMLFTAPVKTDKRLNQTDTTKNGLNRLRVKRSSIPAVTHVDYSSRIQTINHSDNPLYYDLIKAFFKKTGCPVIINTSFNIRGEPIVCTPEDAFKCFIKTDMDYLIIGSFILNKAEQKIKKDEISSVQPQELD